MDDSFTEVVKHNELFMPTSELKSAFYQWAETNCTQDYINSLKQKISYATAELNKLGNPFINGRKGVAYEINFTLPECIGNVKFYDLEKLGLQCTQAKDRPNTYLISGIPTTAGNKEIHFSCTYAGWVNGAPLITRQFSFLINPNPRELWKNIPVPPDIEYPKPDYVSDYIRVEQDNLGNPNKSIIAASRRGRSHEHAGKPRDDHFIISHCPESNWYIIAVADGAGSAEFSRQGSKIACTSAVQFCEQELNAFDNEIDKKIWIALKKGNEAKLNPTGLNELLNSDNIQIFYDLLARSAHLAHKNIKEEALKYERAPNLYATTLLLLVCKKFANQFWILASFNIGDGAIGIVAKNQNKSCLFCTPDEGEFSGQTRFVTMPEIFSDYYKLKERINVLVVNDFTAALVVTDGVSDAKFESDANLRSPQKWNELWDDITSKVQLDNDSEQAKNELLDWLGFWSQGNHDDRTIAIIY